MTLFNKDGKKNIFKCTICDFTTPKNEKKSSSNRGSMFTHIKSLHKDEIISASHNSKIENRYDCGNSECKAFYGSFEGKKFWCTKCTELEDSMIQQRKQRSEIKEKPTNEELCTDCGITVQNLKIHIDNVHNAE